MRQKIEKKKRDIIIAVGQNPNLLPRGSSGGIPPDGLRNWICDVDGHSDPNNSGLCIHCGFDLYGEFDDE